MRFLIIVLAIISLNSCSKSSFDRMIPDSLKRKTSTTKTNAKDIYVIHIHGAWCKTCNSIDSSIHNLETYLKTKPNIEYLVFDETNPRTIMSSLNLAKTKGLGNIFEHERHTGEVLFVDKGTNKILCKVYGVKDEQKYKDIIDKLLKGETVASILATKRTYELSKPSLDKARKAELLVIDIHHDMCSSCAVTAPVFEEVAKKYQKKSKISFLTFDLTSPASIDASRNLARELGIEPIYNAHKHTGEVIFVDLKTKTVLGSLVMETDKNKYYELIKKFS